MSISDTDPQALQERIVRLRLGAYLALASGSGLLALTGPGQRAGALTALAAVALLPHLLSGWETRLLGSLLTDAVVALGLWWIFGPVAGVDFILFYVVAAAGVLLSPRRAMVVIVAALASELAQIPLHFLAEGVHLPVFHPVVQVQSLGGFLGGIGLRTAFLAAAAGLFLTIGSTWRSSLRARQASERRYRELYEEAPYAYFSVDPSGRITLANRRAEQMLGIPVEQLVGRQVLDLYAPTPAGRERAADLLERFREGGEIRAEELEMERADGRRIWVRLTAGVVREADGSVRSSRSVVEDITAERQAELAREEAEERFRSAFEHAPIGMALLDSEGRIVRANGALVALFGHIEEELLHSDFTSLAHPDDRLAGRRMLETLVRGEEEGCEAEQRYLRADGSVVWGRLSVSPVRRVPGEVGYLVAQIVDLTAHRAAQQRLEELVRSKDEFVASVSHELRTPLTAVIGFAEVLEGGADGLTEVEREQLLREVSRSAREVAAIVEDLLVAARADIGRVAIASEQVDLREEAETVLVAFQHDGGRTVAIRGEAPPGWGDPVRVRQIIRNLVTNAIRYGGDRIEIVLGTTDSGRVSVVVRDDGPGVPEGEREDIFAPYYRAHSSPGQPASVGLGLTVSRQLARLMGGDLVYECREGWSSFELTLSASGGGEAGAPAAVAGR